MREFKNYRIKIWGKELICPICNRNVFSKKRIKISDVDNYYEHEIRYIFECMECGYGMQFGAVTKYEPEEELNFHFEEVD